MNDAIEIKVPDIGDFKDVAVIEIMVKPGDNIRLEPVSYTHLRAHETDSYLASVLSDIRRSLL